MASIVIKPNAILQPTKTKGDDVPPSVTFFLFPNSGPEEDARQSVEKEEGMKLPLASCLTYGPNAAMWMCKYSITVTPKTTFSDR